MRCWERQELDSALVRHGFEKVANFGAHDPGIEITATNRLVASDAVVRRSPLTATGRNPPVDAEPPIAGIIATADATLEAAPVQGVRHARAPWRRRHGRGPPDEGAGRWPPVVVFRRPSARRRITAWGHVRLNLDNRARKRRPVPKDAGSSVRCFSSRSDVDPATVRRSSWEESVHGQHIPRRAIGHALIR